jgi:hypothetical protein
MMRADRTGTAAMPNNPDQIKSKQSSLFLLFGPMVVTEMQESQT